MAEAAVQWRAAGGVRLTDRVLLRFGIHEALRLGKPLQFHVGLGDRDCDLHRTNQMLLLDFLRHSGQTPVVLLHCYPYEREAGYLASAFNNVYLASIFRASGFRCRWALKIAEGWRFWVWGVFGHPVSPGWAGFPGGRWVFRVVGTWVCWLGEGGSEALPGGGDGAGPAPGGVDA